MKTCKMDARYLWLFIAVLIGMSVAYEVSEVEAGCFTQIVSDTRECEHLWERQDLPDCINVEALYEVVEYATDLCSYEIKVENRCLDSYEFTFECDSGMFCPDSYILSPNDSEKIKLGSDNYGKRTIRKKVMMMFFFSAKEDGVDGDISDVEKKIAGGFTGSSLGEVKYGMDPDCRDEGFFCQVTSAARPVGGLVGLVVGVLGLVGIVWRRRVLG